MTIAELRHLIEPHFQGILDNMKTEPLECHEGTNHCGCIVLNPEEDDIVFLREVENGRIELQPSHRKCAEAEWGPDHLIPAERYQESPTHRGWPG